MKAKHVIITGRVQGVAFRAWTRDQAGMHDVAGWVRNRSDGSVEAVLSGEELAVEALIEALHRGPAFANVAEVAVTEVDATSHTGFEIRG